MPTSYTFTAPERDEVWLLVSEEVDEDLALELGEGDLDGGAGEVAGVVHLGRLLYLLLRLVGPRLLLGLVLLSLVCGTPLTVSKQNEDPLYMLSVSYVREYDLLVSILLI